MPRMRKHSQKGSGEYMSKKTSPSDSAKIPPILNYNFSKAERKFIAEHVKENRGEYDFEGIITIDSYKSLTGKKWFVCVASFPEWSDGFVRDSIDKCLEDVIKVVKK